MKNSKKLDLIMKLLLLNVLVILPQSIFSAPPGGPSPSVTITAITDAVEPGPNGCFGDIGGVVGQFQITRSDTLGELKVNVTRGGTATGPNVGFQRPCDTYAAEQGIDYTVDDTLPVPCSTNDNSEYVVLADGQASATVSIYPYFDYTCESTETVVMNISISGTNYSIPADKGSATNNIFDTPTFGFFIFTDLTNNVVLEGQPAIVFCKKDCACSPGGPYYGVPITNTFVLLGNAVLTNDYVFDENPNVTVLYWKNPVEINVTMGGSNDYSPLTITTFTNGSYGDKILQFVPRCFYAASCPNTLPYQTNYVDCPGYHTNSYFVGYNEPYLTISHPTIQPTLDSAVFNDPIFQFNINGQSNVVYTVLTSTNLLNWVSVASFTMTSCTMQASDLLATSFSTRFYRVAIGGAVGGGGGEFTFQESSPNPYSSEALRASNAILSSEAKANEATAAEKVQLTPNEEYILIEAQRLELQEKGAPAALLLPPTPLSSPLNIKKAKK